VYQTAYSPLQTIGRVNVPYVGGICKWWYIPTEDIASFPAVNPVAQLLIGEPVLQPGKFWYGPVKVTDKQLGWEEDQQRSKAGIFYKQKIAGFIPGLNANSHINLHNHAYHQFCIVAKIRAGGYFIVLGNEETGMDLDANSTSGTGAMEAPGSRFSFTTESINKALILPAFTPFTGNMPELSIYPVNQPGMEPELLFFTNTSSVNFPYDANRRSKYGNFPSIEVWIDDAVQIYQAYPEILVDMPAPNQTQFTINIAGPISGFIKIH